MKQPAGVVLLHGYGVRGYIWGPVQAALDNRIGPVATPDFDAPSVEDLVSRAKARVRRHSLECDGPVMVAGHSLGAVLAAIAARDLGEEVVAAVVLVAPPYGEREHPPGKLLQFMLRHRLIPPALLRPQFFSPLTPRSTRRAVFKAAVKESPDIQALTGQKRWFHTDTFPRPLPQPTLVIASAADRIVPLNQSLDFAGALGAQTYVFDEPYIVAHDDFFASPDIAPVIADLMVSLVTRD